MKSQTANSNTPAKKRTKSGGGHDTEMLYSFRTYPISQAVIDRMVEELPDWPKKNESENTIEEFYLSRGISESSYYRLLKKNADLKEAHDVAISRLARRVWNRSLEKKYDWNAARFLLSVYSESYKEAAAYHANLAASARAQAEQEHRSASGTVFVEVPVIKYIKEEGKVGEDK